MPSSSGMTMTTIFRDVPKDLVEEILCHIPATNLKQLRSTCKPWNRLFDDKRFARKHSEKAPKEFLFLLQTCEFRICPMRINLHGTIPPSLEVKSEVSLFDPLNSSKFNHVYDQFDIGKVFHCDGLLLCTSKDQSRLVVWNPCTGQTKWIHTRDSPICRNFVLGYFQDKKSCRKVYKILSYNSVTKESEIYEFSSDSWRILDHDIAPGWSLHYSQNRVSLKGSTFVLATDDTKAKNNLGLSLLRFDFLSEKFVHVPLPCDWSRNEATSLSVVKEDKISVLLQRKRNSTTDIWLTNKIDFDDTKAVVSWSKVLALDLSGYDIQTTHDATFLLDEEKKVLFLCETWIDNNDETLCRDMVYIIGGENNQVTPVDLGPDTMGLGWPIILNYVPSLSQIDLPGGKRKRAMAGPL